jgi:putative inorganic carbon (HCO3(-)) transporter
MMSPSDRLAPAVQFPPAGGLESPVDVKAPSHFVPMVVPTFSRATGAYVAFLAFIVTVYSSLAHLFPALEAIAPGKTVIAFAFAALVWACVAARRPFTFGLGAGGGALYVFFFIVVASPLWSRWPDASFEAAGEFIKYLAGFVVAANVLESRRRIRHAAAAIAIASLFPAVGAMHNYFIGENLVEGTRAAWLGVFANPNFLAFHLVMSVPLALAMRDATPAGPNRGLLRLMWLSIAGILVTAILLTGSRGGTLGLGAVLLLWQVRSLAKGRLAIGAAAAVIIALLMTPSSPFAREETRLTLSGQVDASAQGRIDAWRTAERMVYHHPFLGVGAGAFMPEYERFAPGDAGPARAAHNTFAMVAAEVGLPALAAFCVALVGGLLALGRAAKREPPRTSAIARGLQTSLFGFVVCSLTGGYTYSWPLYFVLGMAAALERKR